MAKDRRAELYHHPVGAVRAALAQGAVIANPRKEGNDDVVDITTADGSKLTLYVDSQTKLPSKVTTMTDNIGGPLGDVVVETSFANYADTNGLKLPTRLTTKNDKFTVADIQISANTINLDSVDLAAPADAKSAQAPPAAAPAMVTAEEVGKGLWYLTGQSHHSVLVEFADHLVLVETPQHEVRSAAVVAKAKELRPDKPIKYVINTHHHFDHSGGIRTAIAEGATIITHEGNKAFIEALASRPHTMTPDALSSSPKQAIVEAVADKRVLQDSTRTVEIYHMAGNAHSSTMLMVYFPAERLIVEADVYNPPALPAANAPPPPRTRLLRSFRSQQTSWRMYTSSASGLIASCRFMDASFRSKTWKRQSRARPQIKSSRLSLGSEPPSVLYAECRLNTGRPDQRLTKTHSMRNCSSRYHGHRFPPQIARLRSGQRRSGRTLDTHAAYAGGRKVDVGLMRTSSCKCDLQKMIQHSN